MIDNTENSQRKNKIEDTEQSACTLCPRDCKKNRADGEIGVCGETAAMRIGRAALHMWEEPCISGEKGSGAVFSPGVRFTACIARITQSRMAAPAGRSQWKRLCRYFVI